MDHSPAIQKTAFLASAPGAAVGVRGDCPVCVPASHTGTQRLKSHSPTGFWAVASLAGQWIGLDWPVVSFGVDPELPPGGGWLVVEMEPCRCSALGILAAEVVLAGPVTTVAWEPEKPVEFMSLISIVLDALLVSVLDLKAINGSRCGRRLRLLGCVCRRASPAMP